MEAYALISAAVQKGRVKDVASLVPQALDAGASAEEILNQGLLAGMSEVGEKFKETKVCVPEVLLAARALNKGLELIKPLLAQEGAKPIGKAVICTVKGDQHDIGKNLVKMMLVGAGLEVTDLGVDVAPERVVAAVQEQGARLVVLSALLTTTMRNQKAVIDALTEAGLRDQVKVMVGGAPVTQEFADEIGADAYTPDAATAATVARQFVLGA